MTLSFRAIAIIFILYLFKSLTVGAIALKYAI